MPRSQIFIMSYYKICLQNFLFKIPQSWVSIWQRFLLLFVIKTAKNVDKNVGMLFNKYVHIFVFLVFFSNNKWRPSKNSFNESNIRILLCEMCEEILLLWKHPLSLIRINYNNAHMYIHAVRPCYFINDHTKSCIYVYIMKTKKQMNFTNS